MVERGGGGIEIDLHVREQAGGVKRLERLVDSGGIVRIAFAHGDIGQDRGGLDALGAADRDVLDECAGAAAARRAGAAGRIGGGGGARHCCRSAAGRSCASAGRAEQRQGQRRGSRAQNTPCYDALVMVRIPPSRHSSFGARPLRRPPSFRKDSGEPGHSRWSGASTPGPKPAQAEIRRPGPAHRAAAPKQLRMHSTEDARRRAAELEKGWPAQCLRKVQPPD